MKKITQFILAWFTLSTVLVAGIFITLYYANYGLPERIMHYQTLSTPDVIISICIFCGSWFVGGIFTLATFADIENRKKYATFRTMLDTQKKWIPSCEEKVNAFLNCKYKISLHFLNNNVGAWSWLYVGVSVEDRYQGGNRICWNPSINPSDPSTYFADELIKQYKNDTAQSVLFIALKNYTESLAQEKKWTKPTKTQKTANS